MNKEDIIRMAREAGLYHFYDSESHCTGITDARLVTEDKERWDDRLVEMLAPFAALVVAAERERIIAQNAPEIEKINEHIKALEEAAAAERENCAQVCDEMEKRAAGTECCKWPTPADCAAAIRGKA